MSKIIGYITKIDGEFKAVNSDGSERTLSFGDPIFDGEKVVGDDNSQSVIVIALKGEATEITLAGNEPLLFDSSLFETGFENEELIFEDDDYFNDLINDMNTLDEVETAPTNTQSDENAEELDIGFKARNADEADVNSGLGDAKSQSFSNLQNIESANPQEVKSPLTEVVKIVDVISFVRPDEQKFPENEPLKVGTPPNEEPIEEPIIPVLLLSGERSIEEGSSGLYTLSIDIAPTVDFVITVVVGHKTTEDGDIVEITQDVTIPAGAKSVNFNINTNSDDVYEGNEYFKLSVDSIAGGGYENNPIFPASLDVTIYDDGSEPDGDDIDPIPDDDRPIISIVDASEDEGDTLSFTATLSAVAEAEYDVTFNLSDGTATTADSDYIDATTVYYDKAGTKTEILVNTDGTYTVPVGVTVLVIEVASIANSKYEGAETFIITAQTGSMANSVSATGTITDDGSSDGDDNDGNPDDDRPQMTIGDVTIEEGSNAIFAVTVGEAEAPYDVTFNTSTNGSAEATDITTPIIVKDSSGIIIIVNADGSYTVPAGETSLTVSVPTTDDNIYEGAETFELNGKTEFMVNDTSGIGTILDDGSGPDGGDENDTGPDLDPDTSDDDRTSFSVNDVRISEGGLMTFTVTRTGDAEADQTVEFATSIETGDNSEAIDFGSETGILTFAAGVTEQTFTVQTNQDVPYEGEETFTVTLSNNSEGSTIADATGTGTIVDDGTGEGPFDPTGPGTSDDDRPLIAISQGATDGDQNAKEGEYAYFTLTKTGETEIAGTVSVSVVNGTAANPTVDADFTGNLEYKDTNNVWQDATAGIPVSAATSTVELRINTTDDASLENIENFSVDITSATQMIVDTNNDSAAGSIEDNSAGPPTVVIPDNTDDALGDSSVDDEKVLEAGLVDGTNSEILTNKIFTVTAPDGVKSITIEGTEVVNDAGDFTPQVINTGEGSINVTAYDSATGVFTYTYTLSSAQDHGDDSTDVIDSIAIVVTDDNNVSVNGTLDILIVDSVPIANADTATIVEDTVDITGNVITGINATADAISADVTTVIGVQTGTDTSSDVTTNAATNVIGLYGTINIAADGTYTYTLDNANPTVTALTDIDSLTDTFTYTIKDADGDSSTTTVTITIDGTNDAPVLDLDKDDSTTSGADFITSYALGQTGISIGDIDVGISDVDSSFIESALITLTTQKTGDILFVGDLPNGITAVVNDARNTVTLTSDSAETMTMADYENAIEAINFYNSDTGADTSDRTITVVVNDGATDSNTAITTIQVDTNALSISTKETVEEGLHAVFIIELSEARGIDTVISLDMGGTATKDTDYDGTIYQYESSPGVWTDVVGDSVTIASGKTSIAVKIKTVDDGAGDDGENLSLTGTITSADITNMANIVASASTILTEYPAITVSAPTSVLEGNTAIFEVALTGTKPIFATTGTTDVKLELSGDADANDYSAIYRYSTDGGDNWIDITADGNGDYFATMPATTEPELSSILVEITTIDDGSGDDNESLVLTATTTDDGVSSFGNSASDDTVIVEPLELTATEQKDEVGDAGYVAPVTVTTTPEAGYTYEANGDGANGTVVDNGDGTLTYTPDTDFSGTDSFSYIKVDTTTGERTASSVNVTVVAIADTPDITMSINNQVITAGINTTENADLDSDTIAVASDNELSSDNWYALASPGASGKYATATNKNVDTEADGSGGLRAVIADNMLLQGHNTTTAQDIELTFTVTGTGTVNIYWNATAEDDDNVYLILQDGTAVLTDNLTTGDTRPAENDFAAGTYTITIPASAQLNSTDALVINADLSHPGLNTLIFYATGTVAIDDVSTIIGGSNYTYNVNIDYNITDDTNNATEYEFIQENVTISGVPNGASFSNAAGDDLGSATHLTTADATDTWTFTQAELIGLKITVSETDVTTSPGFDLTATVVSEENVGASTASNSATVTVYFSDDAPIIGDSYLSVTNGSVNVDGTNIITDYSDNGVNRFSWDPSNSYIPELYADNKIVEIEYDNVTGTVTGTIDDGAGGRTTIFTTTINMADLDATTINYTQSAELLGVQIDINGGIVLPGGGNSEVVVLGFNDANGDPSGVDAIVAAHNLIEDTDEEILSPETEHTINTNNYYIGVNSNNMNAGDQLIHDFATVDNDTDGNTTHANVITSMDIKLFNFDSDKSGDELYITIITTDGVREEIILLANDDFTGEYEYTITSSSGLLITGIEFLAGNESSFKLGIDGISSINYDDEFEMAFAYDITDTDDSAGSGDGIHETDSGLATILINSTDDTLVLNTTLDGQNDSVIVYDPTDANLDAGSGMDTLVFATSGVNIDFGVIANDVMQNIEKIDLDSDADSGNGTHALENITLADIVGLTDSNNELKILGSANDTITLDSENGNTWSTDNTVDADGFKTYVNSGDNTVTVKIDEDVNSSII